jgi:acylpyruvate hydrolase
MRLVVHGPQHRVGLVHEDQVIDICAAYATYLAERTSEPFPQQQAALTVPAELGAFIAAGERALSGAQDAVSHLTARGSESGLLGEPLSRPLPAVTLHPPLAARARMFLAGNNYPAHAAGAEGNPDADLAAVERVRQQVRSVGLRGFISFPETCVGPGEGIIHPARTDMLDFEGEIAVVVGGKCKDVAAADAHELFWGFFLLNDVSARRAVPVADNPRSRFARDKNFDSSKCAGPFVVVNEFDDAQDIRWETRVNGEIRQRGHTRDMIFSFAEMLEYLSQDMTLFPGDIISGGTTSGTILDTTPVVPDLGRDPSAFLHVGDVIEISNPVLGTLRNPVVAKPGLVIKRRGAARSVQGRDE